MTPGQQMALMPAANGSDIKPVQLEPYIDPIAWMKGRFQFHETPFADIMRQVSRWYDVEVQYDIPVPQKIHCRSVQKYQINRIPESARAQWFSIYHRRKNTEGKSVSTIACLYLLNL
jgi:hypothetical protein